MTLAHHTLSILFVLLVLSASTQAGSESAPADEVAPPLQSNHLGMQLARIPAGTFRQGTPEHFDVRFENETPHEVRLTNAFWMSTTHVTVSQFAAFVDDTDYRTQAEEQGWSGGAWNLKTNEWDRIEGGSWRAPGFDQDIEHPVVSITWADAVAFCQWLSEKEGRVYRLPTEAEWEYACRAGADTLYPWGDDPADGEGWANCSDQTTPEKLTIFPPFDWSDGFAYTSPVARFRPNSFGLYDMIGNTLQWCSDWYGDYPSGPVTDPTGPAEGEQRVLRGGAFVYGPQHSRCAFRGRNGPEFQNFYIGFRVVMEAEK